MTLTAQGKVTLHTSTYPLDAINDAMADLDGGRLQGRGILDPRRRLAQEATMGKILYFNHDARLAAAGRRRRAGQHGQGDARAEGPQRRARAARPARRRSPTTASRSHARSSSPTRSRTWARSSSREVANKTSELTGDGTTTAHSARPGDRARGHAGDRGGRQPDAAAPRHRGGDRAGRAPSSARQRAADRGARATSQHVATIAAKEDERIGAAVAEALHRVGRRGRGHDRGVPSAAASRWSSSRACTSRTASFSPYLVQDATRMETVLRGPLRAADEPADLARAGPDADARRGR